MEIASREVRERRNAEIHAKMDAQQRAHDERVRQLQKENDEMDRRYEEEINSRKNSKLALLIHIDLHLPLTQPPNRSMDRTRFGRGWGFLLQLMNHYGCCAYRTEDNESEHSK
jgi:hypothetical protein